MITKTERGLSCTACGWENQGPILQTDGEHANRYEVREYGNLIGYITADRPLSHLDVQWKRELCEGHKTIELDGTYQTKEEALAAF